VIVHWARHGPSDPDLLGARGGGDRRALRVGLRGGGASGSRHAGSRGDVVCTGRRLRLRPSRHHRGRAQALLSLRSDRRAL